MNKGLERASALLGGGRQRMHLQCLGGSWWLLVETLQRDFEEAGDSPGIWLVREANLICCLLLTLKNLNNFSPIFTEN